jgi:hypothetical protein
VVEVLGVVRVQDGEHRVTAAYHLVPRLDVRLVADYGGTARAQVG